LSGNAMAGDLSDSKHYFDIDLIQPEIAFPNGWMTVPTGIGIGLSVNETLLKGYTVNKLIMTYFR
ncbi:MAG: o-succinylbenzoate synthase, partial [Lactococcus lactis]|nr:o-succinylbenzoate synthase [Lactococcus lactis]MDN5993645.1 o-succinylbenzoate synthase [Lactococcus lactis]MDN6034645.1 o-succinylbenzoate synthase [Lactococcus lactis]MDN6053839.1 o-succinylbenzoate synthase [Lactococcus lactis]MDN6074381.1 o-succinylbenzoate synthase [Lactococcus lactis]